MTRREREGKEEIVQNHPRERRFSTLYVILARPESRTDSILFLGLTFDFLYYAHYAMEKHLQRRRDRNSGSSFILGLDLYNSG